MFVTSEKLKALLPTAIEKSGLSSLSVKVNFGVASLIFISPLVTVPVVNIFCATKLGVIFDPAIAALAFISALTIAPDVTSVPFSSGTVSVLVVLLVIPEHSKASCFVLSELSLTLNHYR